MVNNTKNICIIRLSAIGDVINLIPTIQEILRQKPNYKLTLVIGKTEYYLIKHIIDINFIVYDKSTGINGMYSIFKSIKHIKFDILLHMQTSLRSSILSLFIRSHRKIGFSPDRSIEFQGLFVNEKLNNTNSIHIADAYMDFLPHIGLKRPAKINWNINIDKTYIDKTSNFIHSNKLTILISPGSSKKEKNWCLDNYIDLIEKLFSQGTQVILTGSNNDIEKYLCNEIEKRVPNVLNLVGKTNLIELASLISQVDLFIGPDSGPLHLANALGIKNIGLFAYKDPKRTGPYNNLKSVVSIYDQVIDISDKKNSKWGVTAKGKSLMKLISVDLVMDKIKEVLDCDANSELNQHD